MLIERRFSENDPITVKLISGEELIARFLDISDKCVTIIKPMLVTMCPEGVELSLFLLSVPLDVPLSLNRDHVIFVEPSEIGLGNYYINLTKEIEL